MRTDYDDDNNTERQDISVLLNASNTRRSSSSLCPSSLNVVFQIVTNGDVLFSLQNLAPPYTVCNGEKNGKGVVAAAVAVAIAVVIVVVGHDFELPIPPSHFFCICSLLLKWFVREFDMEELADDIVQVVV